MQKKFDGFNAALLLTLAVSFSPSLNASPVPNAQRYALDGHTFSGNIKAKGLLGLVSVNGDLSFKNGLLYWSTHNEVDSAPYSVTYKNGYVIFKSKLLLTNGTQVDWVGQFDGENIREVLATWHRENENDFIHDLFLPDVVTLTFSTNHKYKRP